MSVFDFKKLHHGAATDDILSTKPEQLKKDAGVFYFSTRQEKCNGIQKSLKVYEWLLHKCKLFSSLITANHAIKSLAFYISLPDTEK